jgi:hypothetical protein
MTNPSLGNLPSVRRFHVYEGGRLVLTVADEPGALLSTAAPPVATPPGVPHPFLDAQAHDAVSEDELRRILLAASDFDDFLRRLLAAGYDINASDAPELGPGHRITSGGRLAGAAWPGQGLLACLWWPPERQGPICQHTVLAAYDVAHAPALRDLAAASANQGDFVARLERAGYRLDPLGR